MSRSSTLLSGRVLLGLSGRFQRDLSEVNSLATLYFVVIPAYDTYASTKIMSSRPIEWILDGVQGFSEFTTAYVPSCDI